MRWLGRSTLLAAALVLIVASPHRAAGEQATQPSSAIAGTLDLGRYHSCALLPGGALRCWGYGGDGALGYGTALTVGIDETPAAVGPVDLGLGRTATAVATGHTHTCALLDNAAVRCWGFAGDGRLGYALGFGNMDRIGDNESPGSVGPVDLGPGRTARAISAGRKHTCAILDDATVRCWGYGFDGSLGYGNNIPRNDNNVGDDETPGSVAPVDIGAGRTAKAISTGDAHTCAILDNGSVRCWGEGRFGQLGYENNSTIGDDETPGTVGPVKLGAGRTAVAIAAGDFHTCALLDDGNVRCWGYGGRGRLGYANTDNIGILQAPEEVGTVDLGPGRTARAIAAGNSHTCVLLDDGSVRCWGSGLGGQLGYANSDDIGDNETPGAAGPVDLGAGRTAVAIAAGVDRTCARLDDGHLLCWGTSLNGELGRCSLATIGDDETPASAGPVDLGTPGTSGGCPAPPPPPPSPSGRSAGSGPPSTPPGAPRPLAPTSPEDAALAGETARAAGLRRCRAAVTARARGERRAARTRYRDARRRALALRRIDRRAARGTLSCVKRFGRTPGRVTTFAARATARGKVVLTFRAIGSDGAKPPPARGYLVKQSTRPIRTAQDFERAKALCKGICSFSVTKLGAPMTLTVVDLRRATTYYYAIAARDNVSGRRGPRSKTIAVKTRG